MIKEVKRAKKDFGLSFEETVFVAALWGRRDLSREEAVQEILNQSRNRDFLQDDVQRALKTLSQREQNTIYYVFDEGMTLEMAGKCEGVSGERMRVVLSNALRKLRSSNREGILTGTWRETAQDKEALLQ